MLRLYKARKGSIRSIRCENSPVHPLIVCVDLRRNNEKSSICNGLGYKFRAPLLFPCSDSCFCNFWAEFHDFSLDLQTSPVILPVNHRIGSLERLYLFPISGFDAAVGRVEHALIFQSFDSGSRERNSALDAESKCVYLFGIGVLVGDALDDGIAP